MPHMVPNFALDLSEDGIVFLHRDAADADWRALRDVSLDDDDLAAKLHDLRDLALELEGEDFSTKLILPPSQLLYARVPVGHNVQGDVERALETRTPYTIDQLSYDMRGTPPEVQVVAVARDTLREAEDFIAPYGLNPIGFTARPEPDHFQGEPNLGKTQYGDTVGFQTDLKPVPSALQLEVSEEGPEEDNEVPATPEPFAAVVDEDTPPETNDPGDQEPDVGKTDAKQPDQPAEEPAAVASGRPAAFSSRRQGSDTPPEDAGERVTKLSARIGIPGSAPKLGGMSAKPPRKTTTKADGETKAVRKEETKEPSIVPVAAPAPPKPKAKSKAKPQRSEPAVRSKGRKKTDAIKPPVPLTTPGPQETRPDPIAELAAKQAAERPRRLGVVLTLMLLVALGLFAVLSSYLLPEETVARLFGRSDPAPEATASAPDDTAIDPEALADGVDFDVASLPSDTTLDYVQPAPSTPDVTEVAPPRSTFTVDDAETAYALSGVWQKAPLLDADIPMNSLDDLYVASIDPDPAFEDAPALPNVDLSKNALGFEDPGTPPPAGLRFTLDERGFVVPTREGAINPQGILIYAGAPPVRAQQRPDRAEVTEEPHVNAGLAAIRPILRPDNLIEQQERATLNGLSRTELSAIRPSQRPASAQARAEAIARALAEAESDSVQEAEAALAAATKLAVANSQKPSSRPGNFSRIVAAARAARPEQPQPSAAVQTASASTASTARAAGPAVARSSRASPNGRTTAAVARAATDNNALALGKLALVGVFGTASNRRALVRMPNGRFKKVSVGDRVDGGRVAAIEASQLRYTKGGRTVTLKMPKG